MNVGDKVFVKNQPCAAFKLTKKSGDLCTISGGGVTTTLSCGQLSHVCSSNMSPVQSQEKVLFKAGDGLIEGKVISKLSDGRYSIKTAQDAPSLRRARSSIIGI